MIINEAAPAGLNLLDPKFGHGRAVLGKFGH